MIVKYHSVNTFLLKTPTPQMSSEYYWYSVTLLLNNKLIEYCIKTGIGIYLQNLKIKHLLKWCTQDPFVMIDRQT